MKRPMLLALIPLTVVFLASCNVLNQLIDLPEIPNPLGINDLEASVSATDVVDVSSTSVVAIADQRGAIEPQVGTSTTFRFYNRSFTSAFVKTFENVDLEGVSLTSLSTDIKIATFEVTARVSNFLDWTPVFPETLTVVEIAIDGVLSDNEVLKNYLDIEEEVSGSEGEPIFTLSRTSDCALVEPQVTCSYTIDNASVTGLPISLGAGKIATFLAIIGSGGSNTFFGELTFTLAEGFGGRDRAPFVDGVIKLTTSDGTVTAF